MKPSEARVDLALQANNKPRIFNKPKQNPMVKLTYTIGFFILYQLCIQTKANIDVDFNKHNKALDEIIEGLVNIQIISVDQALHPILLNICEG